MYFTRPNGQAMRGPPDGSSAGFAILEYNRYPMAWKQLFGSLQGLLFVGSENWCYRDALGQVSNNVK